jgi:hypothetical protein
MNSEYLYFVVVDMIVDTIVCWLSLTALSRLFILSRSDGQQIENGYDRGGDFHLTEEAVGVEVSYANAPQEAEELIWI